jgi:hypothetical protein
MQSAKEAVSIGIGIGDTHEMALAQAVLAVGREQISEVEVLWQHAYSEMTVNSVREPMPSAFDPGLGWLVAVQAKT